MKDGLEPYNEKAYKLTVVLSVELDAPTALNTAAHIAVALGAQAIPNLTGHGWPDGSGQTHSTLAKYPVIALRAKSSQIRRVIESVRESPAIYFVDYPEEAFTTTNDIDYGNSIQNRHEADIHYIGVGLFGPAEEVRGLCGRFSLWRP